VLVADSPTLQASLLSIVGPRSEADMLIAESCRSDRFAVLERMLPAPPAAHLDGGTLLEQSDQVVKPDALCRRSPSAQ
jgi:hypothetical protein